jgi:hypothetical protein
MIVHLAGSLRDVDTDADYLRQIIEAVHLQGGVLAQNWLDAALTRAKQGIAIPDWTPYVETEINAIKHADVIIVDLTHYVFSQGFIVAAALRYKKPVLAVSRNIVTGHTAVNIKSPLYTYKKYDSAAELQQVVTAFLKQNTVHTKDLRFNMFLTRKIYKYLDETSRETGKNKSEIIRALVKRKAGEEQRG